MKMHPRQLECGIKVMYFSSTPRVSNPVLPAQCPSEAIKSIAIMPLVQSHALSAPAPHLPPPKQSLSRPEQVMHLA